MAGRPREFDREAALEAAMLLFWRKGYAAASMNDLCEAMGVRSPSLYAAFESKEALYLAAIEHYVQTQAPPVRGRLSEGATARDGVANEVAQCFRTAGIAALRADLVDCLEKIVIDRDGNTLHLLILVRLGSTRGNFGGD